MHEGTDGLIHIKYVLIRLLFIPLFCFHYSVPGQSPGQKAGNIRLMFYNVENLFDVINDTTKNDDDFLPGGVLRWNQTRYNRKINSIFKTIIAAGEWSPPAIISLCEVENRKVLEDLVSGTNLVKFNYGIIHEESPDPRGIDVSILYRRDFIDVITFKYWIPTNTDKKAFTSRSILYLKCRCEDDTLHIIVNHWPSKRGGVLASDDIRVKVALMVKEKTDSILKAGSGKAKLVIGGDFNCTPDDQIISNMIKLSGSNGYLVNLTDKLALKGYGTYRYQGTWEMIDQIFVSDWLINTRNGLYTNSEMINIFKPDFLLRKDPKYPGVTPFATYSGYKYIGGFSDHLPLIVNLAVR